MYTKELSPEMEIFEQNIISYCINTLGLKFGEFWYSYYPSGNKNKCNATIAIYCNEKGLLDKIIETFPQIEGIEPIKMFKKLALDLYTIYDLTSEEVAEAKEEGGELEFRYKYWIQFKSATQVPDAPLSYEERVALRN